MILFSFTEKVTDFNKRDEASYAIIIMESKQLINGSHDSESAQSLLLPDTTKYMTVTNHDALPTRQQQVLID